MAWSSLRGANRQPPVIAKRMALLVTGSAEPQCLVVLEVSLSPAPRSRVGTSSLLSHPARPLAQPPPAHLNHLSHLGRRVAPLRTRSGSTQAARRCPRGWWRGITNASAAGRTRATGRALLQVAGNCPRPHWMPRSLRPHAQTAHAHAHMHPLAPPATPCRRRLGACPAPVQA